MSGRVTGRAPRTDAEWAREIEHRLRAIEQPMSLRVGDWVFNSQDDNLVVSRPGTPVYPLLPSVTEDNLDSRLRGYVSHSELTEAITGSPVGGTTAIQQWWENVPFLSDIVEALTGVVEGGLQDLADIAVNWNLAVTNVNTMISDVVGATAGLSGLVSFLQSVFNPINPPSMVGIGQIANVAQNLLFNPLLETADALAGELVWVWDNITHAAAGGSALVDAAVDGAVKALQSNPVQAVLGDAIEASAWVKWDSLVHTGDPISLVLNLFDSSHALIDQIELEAATITGATSDWVQLTGSHVIDDINVAWSRLQFTVDSVATAGEVWFSQPSLTKPSATAQLPSTNILDALGGPGGTVADTFQGIIDGAVAGFNGLSATTGNSITDMVNSWNYTIGTWLGFNGTTTPTPGSQIGNIRTTIDTRATTKPAYDSLDPTSDPVFDISKLMVESPLPTIPVVEATSVIGFVTTPDGGIKDGIAWLGYPTGGNFTYIDALYLNVYRMDLDTGALTFLWTSGDISGSLPDNSDCQWNFFDIPDEDDIISAQGDWYAIEMTIVGSGTFNILGVTSTIPANEANYPNMIAARRTGLSPSGGEQEDPPATVAEPDWAAATPWFALSGTAGEMTYPPSMYVFGAGTGQTFDIPDWANHFDVIVFGAGGGGVDGAYLVGGFGGSAGGYTSAASLSRGDEEGDDFPSTTTTMTVNVGSGGGRALAGGSAGAGGGSSVEITGYASSPIQASGGAGGVGNLYAAPGGAGGGGGSMTVNGKPYYQGGVQGAPGGWGQTPGGGAAGGNCVYSGHDIYGGNGAPGGVAILVYP